MENKKPRTVLSGVFCLNINENPIDCGGFKTVETVKK